MALAKLRPRFLNADLPPEEVGPDAWTRGQNVLFRDDVAIATPGALQVYGTPLVRPRIGRLFTGPAPRVVYAGSNMLAAYDGGTHANITPAAGWTMANMGDVTGGMFNGLGIINDQVHAPHYWAGVMAAPALPFPGWPVGTFVKAIRPFKYQIVGCNISAAVSNPYGIMWSNSAAPGAMPTSWTPLATNDAGNVTLAGAQSPLIDMAPLRDAMAVFESYALWLLQPIGGAFVFSTRRMLNSIGLLCRSAWAALDVGLLFVGDGDIVLTDGQSTRSILNRKMRSAIFSTLSANAINATYCARSAERQSVMIAFPEGADLIPRRALWWNYAEDKVGIMDLPEYSHAFPGFVGLQSDAWDTGPAGPWDGDVNLWDSSGYQPVDAHMIACRTNWGATGRFEALGLAESPDDGPLEVILAKEQMNLAESRLAMATRIFPKVTGPAGVELLFRVGAASEPGASVAWGPEVSFILGTHDKVDCRVTGRYISVMVRSVTPRVWKMAGFDVEFYDAGER